MKKIRLMITNKTHLKQDFRLFVFNGISTIMSYLMPNPHMEKYSNDGNSTYTREEKGIHTFPRSICLKVNVIERLKFELVFYDDAVQHVNHYTTESVLPNSDVREVLITHGNIKLN